MAPADIFPIYSVAEARRTILNRIPVDETLVPQIIQDRITAIFGEALTPEQAVRKIILSIRHEGDSALREWTARLDGAAPEQFQVPVDGIRAAFEVLPADQRSALQLMAERVRKFHEGQRAQSWITQDPSGTVGQLLRPIQRVGIYVPAGTAPLPSSVIMSAVPAKVAGVPQVVVVSPPTRGTGVAADVILAACYASGVDEVYSVGGAQAIAALAYGTESIPPVDKIFGPGNLFVSLAKQQVYGSVGIDGLAGPTETVVIADEQAKPAWVAADLLAQAEHDILASAILLTPSRKLVEEVQIQIAHQVENLSRSEIITASLANRGGAVLTRDDDEAVELANAYAPEHLCLAVRDPWKLSERVTAAGGLFLGENSFEVLGDYAAGPSHVMPTGGTARFASPLNVWDFMHIISLVALNPLGAAQIIPSAAVIAEAEGLDAHAQAARIRLEQF